MLAPDKFAELMGVIRKGFKLPDAKREAFLGTLKRELGPEYDRAEKAAREQDKERLRELYNQELAKMKAQLARRVAAVSDNPADALQVTLEFLLESVAVTKALTRMEKP